MINKQQKQQIEKLLKSKTSVEKICEITKLSKKEVNNCIQELKPKQYTIKLETYVPATLTYNVMASSPEEAMEVAKKTPPAQVSYKLPLKRDIKTVVYEIGSALIKLIKNHR